MNSITLLSWNINGIRAIHKKGNFETFMKQKADIVCFQETKASRDQLSFDIQYIYGYDSYFESGERKGYSGVALYSSLPVNSTTYSFGNHLYDTEGRIIRAEINDFILYNIYFPNGKASPERLRYKMGFYESFLKTVKNELALHRNIIVCGDVNTAHKPIDLTHPNANKHISGFLDMERDWIDRFIDAGMIDTLRIFHPEPEIYTWWHTISNARERNVGWRIDYIFVSTSLKKRVVDAFTQQNVYGSDHCPVGIRLKI